MNKSTIDILLATYNGEEYIAAQIYSLLSQTHKNWMLYVADDGSTDNTIAIIKSIMFNDDRLHIVDFDKPVKNAAKNFWRLLPYSKSDFAIFCDQDDVWLDCKLMELLNVAKNRFDNTVACLVYCDTYIYDEKQKKITADTLYPITFNSFEDLIFHNGGYQGSSILFNKALRYEALAYHPEHMYIHDEIITLIAHCFGDVFHLDKPLMLYRIHENNHIGKLNDKNTFFRRLNNLLCRDIFVVYRPSYNSKVEFYSHYQAILSKRKLENFNKYFDYIDSSFSNRVIILLSGSLTRFRIKLIYSTLIGRLFNKE